MRRKDIQKYNPFYDILNHHSETSESNFVPDDEPPETVEAIKSISIILENCSSKCVNCFNKYSSQYVKNNDTFSLHFLNIDGNNTNFDTFTAISKCISHKFSVIVLAETNTQLENKNLYEYDNYSSIYQACDESKRKGSGVALYIRNHYNFSKFSDASFINTDIESVFVELTANDDIEIIVGVVYRPPSGCITSFNNYLDKILSLLPSKKHVYIMGDFNINLFKDCKATSLFEESILSNSFFSTISIATHCKPNCKKICIDNILTNRPELILSSNVIRSDISHHQSMVLLTQLCNSVIKTLPENNISSSYGYSENNLRLVSQSVEKILVESSNINDFESLINLIKSSISDNCKVNKCSTSKRTAIHNLWVTQGILKSARHRDKLYRAWKKTVTKVAVVVIHESTRNIVNTAIISLT